MKNLRLYLLKTNMNNTLTGLLPVSQQYIQIFYSGAKIGTIQYQSKHLRSMLSPGTPPADTQKEPQASYYHERN